MNDMSDNLAIGATGQAASFASEPKSAGPTASATPSTGAQPQFPSPVEHLNAALGIEVLQFAGQDGTVGQSFPSQRQLDAYRDAGPTDASASRKPGAIA